MSFTTPRLGMPRDPLAPLLADGVVEEVVGRLKSGKEAEVWLVRHAGEVVAAKVYKERAIRSFRNDAGYTEGRRVRNTRTQRAIERGSRFGQAAAEDAWKTREADALHALHAAGVRVPRPVMFYEGVLLMELVVDARGHPAPRLIDAHVSRDDAAALYHDLRRQVVAMLCCDLVHGDLSPYNVLLGRAGPVLIDFPQTVGAAHNNQAERFLRRDLENLRRFLAQQDPALHAAAGDAHEIWRAYTRRELTPEFVPSQRPAEAPRSRVAGESRPAHATPTSHPPARPAHGPPPAEAGGHHQHPARGRGTTGRPGREQRGRGQRHVEVVRVGSSPATGGTGEPSHGGPMPVPAPSGSAPRPQARRRRRRRHRRGGGAS